MLPSFRPASSIAIGRPQSYNIDSFHSDDVQAEGRLRLHAIESLECCAACRYRRQRMQAISINEEYTMGALNRILTQCGLGVNSSVLSSGFHWMTQIVECCASVWHATSVE